MQKLETFIVEKFPGFIFAFALSWFILIAYGLLNQ
jgi:hypothetical protein